MLLNNKNKSLLSIYSNGVWSPYSLSNIQFKKLNPHVRYAILQVKVGLLDVGETNASNVRQVGEIGSYLFKDDEGNLTLMSPEAGLGYVNAN